MSVAGGRKGPGHKSHDPGSDPGQTPGPGPNGQQAPRLRSTGWPRRTTSRSPSNWRRSGPSSTGSVITFDPDSLRGRRDELEQEMGAPGFWDDQQHAARVPPDPARLAKRLDRYESLQRDYDDAAELLAMDGDLADELETSIVPLRRELERLQED